MAKLETLTQKGLKFLPKLTMVLISVLILGYLAKIGQTILAPLFFAFLMALLFTPFANFWEKRLKFPRAASTFMSLVVMVALIFGVIYFFTVELSSFADNFPVLQKQVTKSVYELQLWVAKTFQLNFNTQMDYVNQGLQKLLASSGVILGFTLTIFSSSSAFLAFSFLFFIFILNYRSLLFGFLVSVFDPKHTSKVYEITSEVQRIIKQYIIGLIIQIIITSILTSILLSVLHVKYALLLGVLTGILNVIPYIGIITSGILAALITFVTGGHNIVAVLLGYVGIHLFDANLVLPLVVGSKVKINALFTFIGLLVGEALWGISGMFLSIPFLAILKIIFEKIEELEPYGKVLGENKRTKPRKKYRISKDIIIEEKE